MKRANVVAAFPILSSISGSRDRLLRTVDPTELDQTFKVVAVDGDRWWHIYTLSQDFPHVQSDGQSRVIAGLGETVYQGLELLLGVGRDCCIICEQLFFVFLSKPLASQ